MTRRHLCRDLITIRTLFPRRLKMRSRTLDKYMTLRFKNTIVIMSTSYGRQQIIQI